MRLIQIAKKLNKSTEAIVAFLASDGIIVSNRPNTKLKAKELQILINKLPEGAKLKTLAPEKVPLSPMPPAAEAKDVAATPTITKADTALKVQKPTAPAAATASPIPTSPDISLPNVQPTTLKTPPKTPKIA